MRTRTLLFGALLTAVATAGCAARAGAPISVPHAAVLGEVGNPSADAVSALEAAAGRGDPELARRLDRLLAASEVGPAVWGVAIRALGRNERLYARNPDVLLTPASTMKVVTLAAVAERLGWDHRFETRLLTAAPIQDGTLWGDLVVRGAGDPTLDASGAGDAFVRWADELRRLGIRRIAGRIIGDDDALDDGALETPGFGSGWAWDDLARGFAAPAGALQHRGNVVEVIVTPGSAAGRAASVQFRQGGSGLDLRSEVVTAAANGTAAIRLRRPPGQATLVVSGRIPEGAAPLIRIAAVSNPTLFFVQAFKAALQQRGIEVDGDALDVDSLPARDKLPTGGDLRPLVQHRSEPLAAIGAAMLKGSRNLYAESLVRHLGLTTGPGAHAGRSLVVDVLAGWGVDERGAVVADGSGLSRYTYLTARALVEVLARMYRDPYHRGPMLAALPVAGRDGTLRRRLIGIAAEGVARAKTGSMRRVRALAGFVDTADGEPVAFAILANNFSAPAAEVTRVIDEAVAELAAFPRGTLAGAERARRAAGSPARGRLLRRTGTWALAPGTRPGPTARRGTARRGAPQAAGPGPSGRPSDRPIMMDGAPNH